MWRGVRRSLDAALEAPCASARSLHTLRVAVGASADVHPAGDATSEFRSEQAKRDNSHYLYLQSVTLDLIRSVVDNRENKETRADIS